MKHFCGSCSITASMRTVNRKIHIHKFNSAEQYDLQVAPTELIDYQSSLLLSGRSYGTKTTKMFQWRRVLSINFNLTMINFKSLFIIKLTLSLQLGNKVWFGGVYVWLLRLKK